MPVFIQAPAFFVPDGGQTGAGRMVRRSEAIREARVVVDATGSARKSVTAGYSRPEGTDCRSRRAGAEYRRVRCRTTSRSRPPQSKTSTGRVRACSAGTPYGCRGCLVREGKGGAEVDRQRRGSWTSEGVSLWPMAHAVCPEKMLHCNNYFCR